MFYLPTKISEFHGKGSINIVEVPLFYITGIYFYLYFRDFHYKWSDYHGYFILREILIVCNEDNQVLPHRIFIEFYYTFGGITMNNLKNLFIGLKLKIESLASAAFNMVVNNNEFMTNVHAKSKLRDCIWRADNAYLALTGYSAPKLITLRQLEEVVTYSDTFAKLKSNLESQCSANDAIYILLLSISIANVYKPKGPPVINGGVDTKYLK